MDRVLAIVGLRLKTVLRRSRGGAGVARVLGAAMTLILATFVALAIAAIFGVLTHIAVRDGTADEIRIAFLVAFYTFLFFGVFLPLLTGTMNPGFDASPFRVFPISRAKLYAITLLSSFGNPEHMLYYPALAVVCVTGVLLPADGVVAGLATILLILLFYAGWGNAFVLFLVTVMRRRRAREFLVIVAFMLIVGASIAPSLMMDPEGEIDSRLTPFLSLALQGATSVAGVFPPGIAAETLTALRTSDTGAALAGLFWLVVWDAAGLALGYYVFTRYHLAEKRPGTQTRKRLEPSSARRLTMPTFDAPLLAFIPGGVRAVAFKEIRYLTRSVVGRFNLLMMPVFAVIVVFVFGRGINWSFLGLSSDSLLLFGLLLYATLFSNNFVNNSFAWEGGGVKTYFVSPVPLHRVLAGKNLAVWSYNCVLLLIAITSWSILKQPPDLRTLATAIPLYAVALLIFTTVGNVVSVLFPVARDISSIKNSPSQIAVLLSLVSIAGAGGMITLFLFLPLALGLAPLQPLFLLVLLLPVALAYVWVLRFAGRLMENRKDRLIEELKVID
jgi:hypothetical protein